MSARRMHVLQMHTFRAWNTAMWCVIECWMLVSGTRLMHRPTISSVNATLVFVAAHHDGNDSVMDSSACVIDAAAFKRPALISHCEWSPLHGRKQRRTHSWRDNNNAISDWNMHCTHPWCCSVWLMSSTSASVAGPRGWTGMQTGYGSISRPHQQIDNCTTHSHAAHSTRHKCNMW